MIVGDDISIVVLVVAAVVIDAPLRIGEFSNHVICY